MRQTFDRTVLEAQDKVAVITLNHDATINALSTAMVESLNAALDATEAGRFRALVLTGTGRGFCSGADMKELPARRKEGAGLVLERLFHPLFRRLRDWPAPVVTAINGPAVGIGMSLALMGDLTVAARSSYFLLSFTRIGLAPDGGATFLLPRLIGLARARELALLAEKLPAERALDWGLINRVVDDARLMDETLDLAHRLADGPAALPLTRQLFWDKEGHEAQLSREAAAQQQAGATDDFAEGLAAFLEKREPRFTGK
ncbi:MAG TPA: enoyl-CoA hydratase-related protein [Rhizomicrobium sp.]|nr:enoyl-CoA hydratase-related protein [Rhizomicrobium sp.]